MESSGLFIDEENAGKYSFAFLAGFHLGFPLVSLRTKKSTGGWTDIQKRISVAFQEIQKGFNVISLEYDAETFFPLGKPLVLQYDHFLESIGFVDDLESLGLPVNSGKFKLDHLIWICPSGVVLFIWRVSTDDKKQYLKLRSIMYDDNKYDPSKHYYTSSRFVELANVYIQVALTVGGAVSIGKLNLLSSTSSYTGDFQRACAFLENLARPSLLTDGQVNLYLSDAVKKQRDTRLLFEELLIDVYFLESNCDEKKEEIRVGYIESLLVTKDRQYSLALAVAYSSFIGFLWLRGYLTKELQQLQQVLASSKAVSSELLFRLRLFRVFCTQFISESAPINIRLMFVYMYRIEQFCRESRVDDIVKQIQGQLDTLEDIFNGIEELNKEVRNFKVGIAAILLSLISITAVAAQLISTLDTNGALGIRERALLILLGFIVGILVTIVITVIPNSRYSNRAAKVTQK